MKSDQRRRTVIQAAMRCFASKGYYGTTTTEVANEAGISQPYIYRLFPGKQALFIAVVMYASDRLVAAQTTFIAGLTETNRRDPEIFVRAIRNGYTQLVVQDRELLMLLMQANCAANDPEVAAALRKCFAAQVDFLHDNSTLSDEQIRQLIGAELLANVVLALNIADVHEPWARALSGDIPASLGS